jgi:drug/metabolite transporter (DMT)-like permease
MGFHGSNFQANNQLKSTSLLPVVLALLVTVLFWGSSFPATKLVLRGFTPIAYVFLRFTGATILFALLMIGKLRRLSLQTHLKLALIALFEPTLYFIFESTGMQYTSASSASIIIAAVPGVVGLMAGIFLKEHLNLQQWSGVVISIIGVVLLVGFDDNPTYTDSALLGNGLILLAVFSTAFYMILARHLSAKVTAKELTFYQIGYGMLFLLPVFLIHEHRVEWQVVNMISILALLFLILGATIVGFLAYNYAISKVHVSRAAVFLNGIPLVSVAVSAILLGERLGINQLAGGLIVIVGVTLANLHHRPPAVPTPIVS